MFNLAKLFKKEKDLTARQYVESLKGESDSIVAFVNDVIDDLNEVNRDLNDAITSIDEDMAELEAARKNAQDQFVTNNKVISKFKTFFD